LLWQHNQILRCRWDAFSLFCFLVHFQAWLFFIFQFLFSAPHPRPCPRNFLWMFLKIILHVQYLRVDSRNLTCAKQYRSLKDRKQCDKDQGIFQVYRSFRNPFLGSKIMSNLAKLTGCRAILH
jgi:hypothetical protein